MNNKWKESSFCYFFMPVKNKKEKKNKQGRQKERKKKDS